MSDNTDRLLKIMQQLRDPQQGCAWDLQQDFASIAVYTIEEAYEVADAIEQGNLDDLKDELGDLLLQVVFHSQMAKEQGAFSFEDVAQAICEKMTRRHPHVFGPKAPATDSVDAKSVRESWQAIKQSERESKGRNSVLDDVPRGMAELQRATKLQRRAASTGFDWDSAQLVMAKLHEETAELEAAMALQQQAEIEEELGDLMFTLVNLGRKMNIDTAQALRSANAKFEQRFRAVEQIAGGRSVMINRSIDELEQIWQEVKQTSNPVEQALPYDNQFPRQPNIDHE